MDDDQARPPRSLLKADRGRDVLVVRALEHVVGELGGVGVSEVRRLPLLGEDVARDVGEPLAHHRGFGVAEAVGDRLEVRHQGIHRALAGLRDRKWRRVGVETGEKATEGLAEPLAEQPHRQRDRPDHEVEQLGRAVENAVGAARGGE